MIATFNDGLSLVHLLLDRMRECRPSGPRQQRHLDMRDNRKRAPARALFGLCLLG